MSSFTKRKQLVNELRKAHFPFGFEQPSSQSQYTSKYPVYNQNIKQQANQNARKNNFSIGNQNQIANNKDIYYCSQFMEKFPNHNVKEKQEAIGKKNVGNNNIVFGYDDEEKYKTNYKDEFDQKVSNTNRVKPSDVKKANIDFGDSLTDFTTTYAQIYDKKTPLGQNNSSGKVEARRSHITLGNDKTSFQTQSNAVFNNRGHSGPTNHIHKESNSSNINFGHDNVNYSSECKERFASSLGTNSREVVPNEVIRDFRSAHFHFGFPESKQVGESEAKQQYNQKPIEVNFVNGKKPSNVQINVDGNGYYESSYGREFANWGTQPRNEANKNGRKDNVLIGTEEDSKERYISEAKDNFGSKLISRVQPIKAQGTLQLGEEKSDFLTHNQLTYNNKFSNLESNKFSKEDINRMKTVNIVTGFEGNNYNLHSKQYGRQQGERGQLSKQTLSKMKNTNIVLETVPNISVSEGTSYKQAYMYKVGEA